MAMQAESPADIPAAQIVGNAFVEQYYHILHQSPELVYRFYQDSSVLTRPDSNGVITTATTMQGINEKILSLNYKDTIAEIKTADAQESLGDGVVVLVTGYLTGSDNIKKKFAQSFFLAPQEKGFYVLNDVFRFVEDEDTKEAVSAPADDTIEIVQPTIQTPEPEQPSHAADLPEHVQETLTEEDLNNEPEVCDPVDIEDRSIHEEEVVEPQPTHLDQTEDVTVTLVPSASQEDEPKRSYAAILKAMRTNPSPTPIRAPAKNANVKRPSSNQETSGYVKPTPVSEAPASKSEARPEKIDVLEEGYSIYVRNLPQTATSAEVEEVFAKFGPIKQGGVQVRSNKQGFCFGFVEFEAADSMNSAIEASPILIGGRKATIEEKRTTSRGPASPNNGRGRYPSSRGGFRNESFRGRGNFSGGRGYGRSDFRGSGEFSGRPRGPAGKGSEGYQRVDQNGTRQGGPAQV
ncbi:nuclear transport factor 2-like [Silene latifolia]|uniref:nuclear transport factor 2-like n=1 Tax=Silene latifolia TaxID=37657 RepID=UPI003D7750CD